MKEQTPESIFKAIQRIFDEFDKKKTCSHGAGKR
jgi:hypothetical protein